MSADTEKLQCDLVMRGGITSGIVCPRAIAKLAKTYDFHSIGGTSAGAIAAAATAAASYGTRKGKDPFQGRFQNLPDELGSDRNSKTLLERLFQPQRRTKWLFDVLMGVSGARSRLRSWPSWRWLYIAAIGPTRSSAPPFCCCRSFWWRLRSRSRAGRFSF
jgi:predicted acylesterase/phospholipase RssA